MHPTIRRSSGTSTASLSAVLRSIGLLLHESQRLRPSTPDFTVLRAMLFYIDEFPEKVHHTKESALLFPLLRERSSELAAMLDRLDADHRTSHRRGARARARRADAGDDERGARRAPSGARASRQEWTPTSPPTWTHAGRGDRGPAAGRARPDRVPTGRSSTRPSCRTAIRSPIAKATIHSGRSSSAS